MKKKPHLVALLYILTLGPTLTGSSIITDSSFQSSRRIEAIVSTEWLDDHIEDADLVILDLREPGLYEAGHIKGSINITAPGNFFECFMDPGCGLWMELPPDDALFKTIGKAGITKESTVVLFGNSATTPSLESAYYGLTLSARVAITLLYAGIENVAILDGGYTRWAAEGRSTSTETPVSNTVLYEGVAKKSMFVQKGYIETRLGKSILVDTREADNYFGIEKDFTSARSGHIPTSKVLPAPWVWVSAGDQSEEATWLSWRDALEMGEMAAAILGENKDKEIIVYCGAGGYASPVFFILSEQLRYSNVKFYDGSMQEWTADPDAPVVKYRYE